MVSWYYYFTFVLKLAGKSRISLSYVKLYFLLTVDEMPFLNSEDNFLVWQIIIMNNITVGIYNYLLHDHEDFDSDTVPLLTPLVLPPSR